jgi:hypothetical protein
VDAIVEPLDYPDHLERLQTLAPELLQELESFRGIDHVIAWMSRRNLAQARIDLVGQDEFSYDFLLELEPEGRWLAFGVT